MSSKAIEPGPYTCVLAHVSGVIYGPFHLSEIPYWQSGAKESKGWQWLPWYTVERQLGGNDVVE